MAGADHIVVPMYEKINRATLRKPKANQRWQAKMSNFRDRTLERSRIRMMLVHHFEDYCNNECSKCESNDRKSCSLIDEYFNAEEIKYNFPRGL